MVRWEHRESSSSALVALEPRGSRPPFFCVHGIDGTSQIFRDLARRLGYDQPFYALRAPGLEEAAEFTPSIEAMAGRYLSRIGASGPARRAVGRRARSGVGAVAVGARSGAAEASAGGLPGAVRGLSRVSSCGLFGSCFALPRRDVRRRRDATAAP